MTYDHCSEISDLYQGLKRYEFSVITYAGLNRGASDEMLIYDYLSLPCLARLLRRDLPETGALGEVFVDQAVGSLVQAALPGMARSREAEPHLQPGGDLPVSGKLLAVVRGQGVGPVPVWT
ncbi:MAG: hypothetical protein OXD44_02870 [Gammaproteobacteria bacterium]|nr:hypothetical protein [Gammaproteobacteria bacterium]